MAEKNEVKLKITAENQADKAIEGVKTGLEKLGISADTVKEQLAGVGAVLTVAGFIELTKRGLESADAMANLAEKTGISTEQLSAYRIAAAQSNTTLDAVGVGIEKLSRNMAQAAIGTGTAATSFKAIGVSVVDANGHLRSADAVMKDVADRFASYKDGAGKAALAQQIFGRTGADLIPLLNMGSDGLKNSADMAQKFGAVLSTEASDKVKEFKDKMDAFGVIMQSVAQHIAIQLIPSLDKATQLLMDPKTIQGLSDLATGFANLASEVIEAAAYFGDFSKALGEMLSGATGFGEKADFYEKKIQTLKDAISSLQDEIAGGGDGGTLIGKQAIDDAKNKIVEFEKEIQRLKQLELSNAFKPSKPPETQTAKPGGKNNDPPIAPGVGAGKAAAAARLAALKADIAAQLALLKDANARALGDLDQQLKDHQVSVRQYYADRVKLQQQAIDAEIAAQRKALAESPAQAERIKIENQIILLERQRGDVAVKAARDQEDAEKKLKDQIEQVRTALLRAQGQTGEATKRQLQSQYADLLASLQAQGDASGVSLVRRLIDVSGAQADLQQVEADYQRALTAMQTAEQGVQAQVTTGLLTQAQGQQKIAELHKETAAQVSALIPKMERLAAATGNPDAILRVRQIQQQFEQLGQVVDANAVRLKDVLQNDLATFFENIATGSRNAGDAFRSFAQSVVADIAKMASEALAASAIKQFFGAAGGSGWGAAISAAATAAGYASGGMVNGPGGPTSDSIPARLSAGEFVVNAQAVKRVGAGMLHAINSLGHGPGVPHGPRLGFAEGGFVPAAAQGAQQNGPSVRIVNVVDPALAAEWVNSPAGEKAIVNLLQRNAGAVKQVLA